MTSGSSTPASMWDELRGELAELASAVRAQLEVELELGNDGLPVAPPVATVTAAAAMQPAPAAAYESGPRLHAAVSTEAGAPVGDKRLRLEQLASEAEACTACELHLRRKRSVFARGSHDAELVFVGEGPGQEEDLQGLPFVGPAGQLLDRMIDAMGFARDDVYICNVVKCRPPENRTPRPEEGIACSRFLIPQLACVAPKVIVALGKCATEHLGVAPESGSWRGRWGEYRGIPVLPTYHPAFLLRSPQFKRVVWDDLQLVLARLGRRPKPRP